LKQIPEEIVDNFDDELKFGPQEIVGNWDYGKVLDLHTVSSRVVGEDESGNPQFETEYSVAGELLHEFKYRDNPDARRALLKIIGDHFAANLKAQIDVVAPVPPSTPGRVVTSRIAEEIAARIGAAFSANALIKNRPTEQMKATDPDLRRNMLADAFSADPAILSGKSVLLADDLYQTGATLEAATAVLRAQGRAAKVYVFAVTRTRKRSVRVADDDIPF